MKAFFISIPHSGERIPAETPWLEGLPEPVLMRDVDRYVNKLYAPAAKLLQIPVIETEWHRYVVDLNRLPDDIDQDSVEGAQELKGKHARGFHWSITTLGEKLMPQPITRHLHEHLVKHYFEPFHEKMRTQAVSLRNCGASEIYHLDAHSMPSRGTKEHRDPGQVRKDIVVSDCDGKSCAGWFKDLIIESYSEAGFEVGVNWPYGGGRVTETYGQPAFGHHSIQVEMSRALYMNEDDKSWTASSAVRIQERLKVALGKILQALPEVVNPIS